jgi:PIN domain nuclease of toxin-antitoxin system
VVLLDTHVVLWWLSANERLSARARREIAKSETVLVSPVTCWEVATLVRKGRIGLDRDVYQWVTDLYDQEPVASAPLSSEISVGAGLLPEDFSGDPADRFLYATARELVVPFVTKDSRLIDYARSSGDVRTIW